MVLLCPDGAQKHKVFINDSQWARVGKEYGDKLWWSFSPSWGFGCLHLQAWRWFHYWFFEQFIGPPGREKTWCLCPEPLVTLRQKFSFYSDAGGRCVFCYLWGWLVPIILQEVCLSFLATSYLEVMVSHEGSRWPWPPFRHDTRRPTAWNEISKAIWVWDQTEQPWLHFQGHPRKA